MNKYWEYCKKRENLEMLESEHGFATYKLLADGSIYLQDIWVEEEYRRSGIATEMLKDVETIGRGLGSKQIWASCDPAAQDSTKAIEAILASNFKLHHIEGALIMLVKEL